MPTRPASTTSPQDLLIALIGTADPQAVAGLRTILFQSPYEILQEQTLLSEQLVELGVQDCSGSFHAFICQDLDGIGVDEHDPHVIKLISKFRKIGKGVHIILSRGHATALDWLSRPCFTEASDAASQAQANREEFHTSDVEVLARLENSGNRAKIEIILRGDEKRVRKTFRASAMIYLEKEIAARENLDHPAISPILDSSANYIEMPFYTDPAPFDDEAYRLFDLVRARNLMAFVATLNEAGYALLDWNSGVALFTADGDMHVVDFEYCSSTNEQPTDFAQALDYRIAPLPDDPFIRSHKMTTYENYWHPIIGLSYDDLMGPYSTFVRAKRFAYLVFRRAPHITGKRLGRALRKLRPLRFRRYALRETWIEYKN